MQKIFFIFLTLFLWSCSQGCINEAFLQSEDIKKNLCNLNEQLSEYLSDSGDRYSQNIYEIIQIHPTKWTDFLKDIKEIPNLNLKNKIQLYFLLQQFSPENTLWKALSLQIPESIKQSSLTLERVMMWENLLVQSFDEKSMETTVDGKLLGKVWYISLDEILFLQEIFIDDIWLYESINIVASREDLYNILKTDEEKKKEYIKLLQIIVEKSQKKAVKDIDGVFLEKIIKE